MNHRIAPATDDASRNHAPQSLGARVSPATMPKSSSRDTRQPKAQNVGFGCRRLVCRGGADIGQEHTDTFHNVQYADLFRSVFCFLKALLTA